MAVSRSLQIIAHKLDLGDEEKVLSKAAEFERLLQAKSTAGNNLSETSKAVICLDLAASIFSVGLDHKIAIKYSGLKGPSYNSSRKVVENLLHLSADNLSVQNLCLTLQCTRAETLADNILQDFQNNSKKDIDLSMPQYVCMAVYQSCRLNNIKVAKGKIMEKSRLKPGQWSKMDAEWTKFADDRFPAAKGKGRTKKNLAVNDDIEMKIDLSPKEKRILEPKIEPYGDWKRRMLEQAYKELREMQRAEKKERKESFRAEREMISPRRSPRKTPQKFSPYKSPIKPTIGIRLLFPKELS